MQGIEYWEEVVASDTTGTWEKENTIKAFEDGQKDILNRLLGLIAQTKLCSEIYNNSELDDTFLKPEMKKLKQELETL